MSIPLDHINSFDIDGVIYIGNLSGVFPGPRDIIVTGRSFEEKEETVAMLHSKGIHNNVFFNPISYKKKTRVTSGLHKAKTLLSFIENDIRIGIHFDDDPIQADEIRKMAPNVNIILLMHNLVEKENVRHPHIVSSGPALSPCKK